MRKDILGLLKIMLPAMLLSVLLPGSVFAAVEKVQPSAVTDVRLPVLDTAAFGTVVSVTLGDGAPVLSELPQGVTADVKGSSVTLRSRVPGVEYLVKGSAEDASLTIVSEFSPLVTLDGLWLMSHGRNAIEISSKEIIFLRSLGNSCIHDFAGDSVADKQSAALKLMGRAMLCGGSFSVSSARRNAVFCTDTLYISDSELKVGGALNSALLCNGSVVLSSGYVALHSTKDVLKCKNGDFVMCGGSLDIASFKEKADGVQAANVYISEGSVNIMAYGAASDGIKAKNRLCISGGNVDVSAAGGALFNDKKSDYSSASCLKSDAYIDISGGYCNFVSDGDGGKGISCDSVLVVSGGILNVITRGGDMLHEVDVNAHASSKGIKCDGDIFFRGGNIKVAVTGEGERSEGVESKKGMYVDGNTQLHVFAYDDAINTRSFVVDGGHIYAYSVANDAIDSNESVVINGGLVIADGSFSPEQGLDVDDYSKFVIKGGTLFSVGGLMGAFPALPMGDGCKVRSVSVTGLDLKKGGYVTLQKGAGKPVYSYHLQRDIYGAVLVASDVIGKGGYSLVLSDSLDGGAYLANGIYKGASPQGVCHNVDFRVKGKLTVLSADGELIDVSSIPVGMPPFGAPGEFPGEMMPPGGSPEGMKFPPMPPQRMSIKSEYGEDNLPNYK